MRMTYPGHRALAWAVAIGLCLLWATPVAAQTTSASIFGQVKDSQGGILPGATVTLTSRTQANTMTATTDAEGRFVFAIVRPDLYSLKVGMQGFKTLERTNVQVGANDKFSAGSMTLEVGAITEEVSVSGRVSELQAQSGRSRWRARRSRTSPPTGASCSTTRCWSLGSSPPAPTPATRWATWAASA
jgi:hypothetical protein